MLRKISIVCLFIFKISQLLGQNELQKHEITIKESDFLLNGKPFPYTGISFFNAIYNPTFNKNSEERKKKVA